MCIRILYRLIYIYIYIHTYIRLHSLKVVINSTGVRASLLILLTQIWKAQFTLFITKFCHMQRTQLLCLNINIALSVVRRQVCHPRTLVYWWNVGESKLHFSANLSFIFDTQYFIASLCLAYIRSRPEWTALMWRLYLQHSVTLTGSTEFHKFDLCKRSHGGMAIVYVVQEIPFPITRTCVSISWKWQHNC